MARRNPDKEPSKQAVALADLLADQQLDLDELAGEYREPIVNLQNDLLYSTTNRNEALWENAQADITLTPGDFAEVPVSDRDDNWSFQLNAFYSAVYMQAVTDSGYLADLVVISDKHSGALSKATKKASRSDLNEIAKEGILNGKLKERQSIRGQQAVDTGSS